VIFRLKTYHVYALFPALIIFLLLTAAFIYRSIFGAEFLLREIFFLSAMFAIVAFITLIIFFRGRKREADTQTMHTLVAVSVKFLLDMVIALFWFFIFKKSTLSSVIVFFVLYLTFTLYSVFYILKILKNRSL
jgi:hypothetical protein